MTDKEIAVTLAVLAMKSGGVANYCDHAEHCEPVDRGWVITAAQVFREQAAVIAKDAGVDLLATYDAGRGRTMLKGDPPRPDWAALQVLQFGDDREHQPDVIGQSGYDQLRHRAFEVAVVVGDFAVEGPTPAIALKLLKAGLRLPTIMRVKLGDA